jgi:hypothetical protein
MNKKRKKERKIGKEKPGEQETRAPLHITAWLSYFSLHL